jgi:hypothetical protein
MPETYNLSAALTIFEDHLPDIRKACVLNIQALESTPHAQWDVDTEVTVEAIQLHVEWLAVAEYTKPMRTVVRRIDGRKQHYKKGITDEDIAMAKEYPLADLFEGKLFGRKRLYGNCPFHNERTPSFYIFPDNRFKCFGCQIHGTPIDYVMLRDNVSFLQAVKTLRGA